MRTSASVLPRNDKRGGDGVAGLCRHAQAGDMRAEARLLERIRPPLKRMLEHIVWDKTEVDDLLHDTLELALRKLRAGAIRQPEQFYQFACGVGRNLLIRNLRQKQRLTGLVSFEQISERVLATRDSSGPVECLIRHESAARLRALIRRLPRARDRRVLIGHRLEGLSPARMARELGLKEAHFYRVLYRARQRLKKLILAEPPELRPEL